MQQVGAMDELTAANRAAYRSGRLDIALLTTGLYLVWQATCLLIPPRRKAGQNKDSEQGEGDHATRTSNEAKPNGKGSCCQVVIEALF